MPTKEQLEQIKNTHKEIINLFDLDKIEPSWWSPKQNLSTTNEILNITFVEHRWDVAHHPEGLDILVIENDYNDFQEEIDFRQSEEYEITTGEETILQIQSDETYSYVLVYWGGYDSRDYYKIYICPNEKKI